MPTTVQFRRGTTAENDNFTGASGELSIDTTLNQVRVHDGTTAGGHVVGDSDHATWTELLATNTAIRALTTANATEIGDVWTGLKATNTAIRSLVSSNDSDISDLQTEDSNLWSAITATNTAIRSITTANATEIGDVWTGLIGTNTAIRALVTSNDTDIGNLQTEDSNLWSAITATNTAIRSLVSSNDNDISNINSNLDQKLGATASVTITGDVAGSGSFSSNSVSISVSQQNNSVDLGTHTTGNYVAGISGTTNEITVSGSGSETATVTIGLPDNVTITNSLNVGGSATIDGDLTVTGNTISVSTQNLSVDDNFLYLNANSGVTNIDLGWAGSYNDGTYAHAGIFRDATDGVFKFFDSYTPEPDAAVDINTGHASYDHADLQMGSLYIDDNLYIGGSQVTSSVAELNLLDGVTATTTELNYVDGVTSAIQTQLNAKVENLGDLSVTATAAEINKLDGVTATTAELNKVDGLTATTTELNYVDGVTSNIQTQLNGKQQTITGAATTIDDSNLTASRAVVSDGSGKIAVSAVTSTELGYLDGVTSAIQTQINSKQATMSGGSGISLSGATINLDSDVRGDMWTMGRDTNDYYTVGTTTHSWYLDGAEDMRLTNTGVLDVENNVIAHSSTVSDRNLKDNIVKIEGALDMVKALNGYTFEYKKDGRLGAGLIAQEVQEVLPRAVTEHEILNTEGTHLVLEYDQLHAILIEAIKDQQSQIEELKNIINSK